MAYWSHLHDTSLLYCFGKYPGVHLIRLGSCLLSVMVLILRFRIHDPFVSCGCVFSMNQIVVIEFILNLSCISCSLCRCGCQRSRLSALFWEAATKLLPCIALVDT